MKNVSSEETDIFCGIGNIELHVSPDSPNTVEIVIEDYNSYRHYYYMTLVDDDDLSYVESYISDTRDRIMEAMRNDKPVVILVNEENRESNSVPLDDILEDL